MSHKMIYPTEGDSGWFEPVAIWPSIAGKPSSLINSTFYAHVESVESEWPCGGEVQSHVGAGDTAQGSRDPRPTLKSVWKQSR